MVSTWLKLSHRDWISITPRKAAKMYQVANWCLRSSGSLGGCFAFGSTGALSRLSRKPRNCSKRQPGAGSMSLVGLSSMSVSCALAVQSFRSFGDLATLVAGALEFVRGGLARAIAAGDSRGAVGRTAGDLLERHLSGM